MNEKEETYEREYEKDSIQGSADTIAMKENIDECFGCSFEDTNEWKPPCCLCKRSNKKDYYRSK